MKSSNNFVNRLQITLLMDLTRIRSSGKLLELGKKLVDRREEIGTKTRNSLFVI